MIYSTTSRILKKWHSFTILADCVGRSLIMRMMIIIIIIIITIIIMMITPIIVIIIIIIIIIIITIIIIGKLTKDIPLGGSSQCQMFSI